MTKDTIQPRTRSQNSYRSGRRSRPQRFLRASGKGLPWRALPPEGPGSQSTRLRDRRYRNLLVLADALGAGLALWLVVTAGPTIGVSPAALAALPLMVLANKLVGLYDRDHLRLGKSTLDEAPRLLQVSGLFTLLVWLLQDALIAGGLTRAQVLSLWAGAFLLMLVGRLAARRLARRLSPPERLLLIGDRATVRHVRGKLEASPANVEPVIAMQLEQVQRELTRPEDFRYLVERLDLHRAIIAPVSADGTDILDVIRVAKRAGVQVSVLPRMLEVVGSAVEFDEVDGMVMLGVRQFGLSRFSWLLKRTFDLVGAAALLILFAPVLLLFAVAIKLDSRGPVLFRQTRVGRDGRHFRICKFRSMVLDAEQHKADLEDRNEADGLFKIADDPRITRVGRLLRKTSLDELPQLLNVLRGEMSLVGPRPLVVDEDARVEGLDRGRLHLTPGMTGHWQVLGSTRIPMHEMVGIDYLYVANWSLWSDVKILLRTVPHVLSRGGV
jgi:exopolysaccharide biosynthesis polyprenyl glycosylphosphotransferase